MMITVTIKDQFRSVPKLDREVLLNRYIAYLNLVRAGFTPAQARLQVFKADRIQFSKARQSYLEI